MLSCSFVFYLKQKKTVNLGINSVTWKFDLLPLLSHKD